MADHQNEKSFRRLASLFSNSSDRETLDCSPPSLSFAFANSSEILVPGNHKSLFSPPSEISIESSQALYKRLENLLCELEESIQISNVRDESCIQPPKITLNFSNISALKARRRTTAN